MQGRTIKHTELDERLDELAREPDRFEERARLLARELENQRVALEISEPSSWRRSLEGDAPERVATSKQFRADVDAIEVLDREDEARLARRIEFAGYLLDFALEEAGLSREDLVCGTGASAALSATTTPSKDGRPGVPARVCRRWLEWHSLRTEMVERNLYLALINVERYSHTTASQQDLIQEGSAALFRAVDGFDWRRGLLFRTYAVHWLNQAFRSYLYNFSNTVRVPVYLQKAMKHVNDAKARLGDASASVERIAEEANLAENLVASAMKASRMSHSLDVNADDDGDGGRLKDVLTTSPEQHDPYTADLEDVSLEESLELALGRLSDRERLVIQRRFGIGQARPHTLAEVAKELGVSLERVRQIQVRAIHKLDNPELRKAVDPFLN